MQENEDEYPPKTLETIVEENENFLIEFKMILKHEGLNSKIITKHLEIINLYINNFLLIEDAFSATEYQDISTFLRFCQKKYSSTPRASVYDSLMKFYDFLDNKGVLEPEILKAVKKVKI